MIPTRGWPLIQNRTPWRSSHPAAPEGRHPWSRRSWSRASSPPGTILYHTAAPRQRSQVGPEPTAILPRVRSDLVSPSLRHRAASTVKCTRSSGGMPVVIPWRRTCDVGYERAGPALADNSAKLVSRRMRMSPIPVKEAETRLGDLIRQAAGGREVIITSGDGGKTQMTGVK